MFFSSFVASVVAGLFGLAVLGDASCFGNEILNSECEIPGPINMFNDNNIFGRISLGTSFYISFELNIGSVVPREYEATTLLAFGEEGQGPIFYLAPSYGYGTGDVTLHTQFPAYGEYSHEERESSEIYHETHISSGDLGSTAYIELFSYGNGLVQLFFNHENEFSVGYTYPVSSYQVPIFIGQIDKAYYFGFSDATIKNLVIKQDYLDYEYNELNELNELNDYNGNKIINDRNNNNNKSNTHNNINVFFIVAVCVMFGALVTVIITAYNYKYSSSSSSKNKINLIDSDSGSDDNSTMVNQYGSIAI